MLVFQKRGERKIAVYGSSLRLQWGEAAARKTLRMQGVKMAVQAAGVCLVLCQHADFKALPLSFLFLYVYPGRTRAR